MNRCGFRERFGGGSRGLGLQPYRVPVHEGLKELMYRVIVNE